MRLVAIFVFFTLIVNVLSKANTQKNAALTESLGQEVIEIGAPAKDIPPEIEEEPSAENDSDDVKTTVAGAKKDGKKANTEGRRKDVDKLDGIKADEEEMKIEKELADIYKDNIDYSDGSPATKPEEYSTGDDKQIGRGRDSFKFSPDDLSDKHEVERFKTSVDDISCAKIKQKESDDPSSSSATLLHYLFLLTTVAPLAVLLC